jgi:hypothetical protein
MITSLARVPPMNLTLPTSLQTRLLIEPCLARWGGVPCALPIGHAGPHESVLTRAGSTLRWRDSKR